MSDGVQGGYARKVQDMRDVFRPFRHHALLWCAAFLASGCGLSTHDGQLATPAASLTPESETVAQPEPVAGDTSGAGVVRMQNCQKELEALSGLDSTKYGHYRAAFDAIMSSAAAYFGVRSQVRNDTQNAIDALYDYKTRRVCAEIHQTLLLRLADTAEKVK